MERETNIGLFMISIDEELDKTKHRLLKGLATSQREYNVDAQHIANRISERLTMERYINDVNETLDHAKYLLMARLMDGNGQHHVADQYHYHEDRPTNALCNCTNDEERLTNVLCKSTNDEERLTNVLYKSTNDFWDTVEELKTRNKLVKSNNRMSREKTITRKHDNGMLVQYEDQDETATTLLVNLYKQQTLQTHDHVCKENTQVRHMTGTVGVNAVDDVGVVDTRGHVSEIQNNIQVKKLKTSELDQGVTDLIYTRHRTEEVPTIVSPNGGMTSPNRGLTSTNRGMTNTKTDHLPTTTAHRLKETDHIKNEEEAIKDETRNQPGTALEDDEGECNMDSDGEHDWLDTYSEEGDSEEGESDEGDSDEGESDEGESDEGDSEEDEPFVIKVVTNILNDRGNAKKVSEENERKGEISDNRAYEEEEKEEEESETNGVTTTQQNNYEESEKMEEICINEVQLTNKVAERETSDKMEYPLTEATEDSSSKNKSAEEHKELVYESLQDTKEELNESKRLDAVRKRTRRPSIYGGNGVEKKSPNGSNQLFEMAEVDDEKEEMIGIEKVDQMEEKSELICQNEQAKNEPLYIADEVQGEIESNSRKNEPQGDDSDFSDVIDEIRNKMNLDHVLHLEKTILQGYDRKIETTKAAQEMRENYNNFINCELESEYANETVDEIEREKLLIEEALIKVKAMIEREGKEEELSIPEEESEWRHGAPLEESEWRHGAELLNKCKHEGRGKIINYATTSEEDYTSEETSDLETIYEEDELEYISEIEEEDVRSWEDEANASSERDDEIDRDMMSAVNVDRRTEDRRIEEGRFLNGDREGETIGEIRVKEKMGHFEGTYLIDMKRTFVDKKREWSSQEDESEEESELETIYEEEIEEYEDELLMEFENIEEKEEVEVDRNDILYSLVARNIHESGKTEMQGIKEELYEQRTSKMNIDRHQLAYIRETGGVVDGQHLSDILGMNVPHRKERRKSVFGVGHENGGKNVINKLDLLLNEVRGIYTDDIVTETIT